MNEAQSLERVNEVKDRHEARLLALPGVMGVAVGASRAEAGRAPSGRYVIKVLVSSLKAVADDRRTQRLPESLEGVPVELEETGEFHAY